MKWRQKKSECLELVVIYVYMNACNERKEKKENDRRGGGWLVIGILGGKRKMIDLEW